jgi:hypothetical protein
LSLKPELSAAIPRDVMELIIHFAANPNETVKRSHEKAVFYKFFQHPVVKSAGLPSANLSSTLSVNLSN